VRRDAVTAVLKSSVRRSWRIRNAIHASVSLLRQQNNTSSNIAGKDRGGVFSYGNLSSNDKHVSRFSIVRGSVLQKIL